MMMVKQVSMALGGLYEVRLVMVETTHIIMITGC